MGVLQDLVKRIEDTAALDDVSKPLADLAGRLTKSDGVKSALSGGWLGHQLHPMLTDVPIGAFVMASALDLTGGRSEATAARRLVGFGILSSIPTAASGASDWAETYGGEQRLGVAHALANAGAVALQSASYVARRRGRRGSGVVLSLAGLGLTMGAGYLGGHLTLNLGVGVNHTAYEGTVGDWTDVAAEADLGDEEPTCVTAGGVPVMIVKHHGSLYALSNTCVHAGGPLNEGTIADGCVSCPWHASRFRLSDGTVERGPAALSQPAWDVRVADGRVEVRSRA